MSFDWTELLGFSFKCPKCGHFMDRGTQNCTACFDFKDKELVVTMKCRACEKTSEMHFKADSMKEVT